MLSEPPYPSHANLLTMLRGLGQRVGRWGGPGPAAAAAAGGAQAGRLFGSSSSGSGAADQSHDREDLYGVLECAPSATQAELKAAFRRVGGPPLPPLPPPHACFSASCLGTPIK